MACTPSHCSGHGTGYTTCSGHRAACSTNRVPGFTDAIQGGIIYASDVNELRSNLRAEVDAYNNHRLFSTSTATEATAYTASATEIQATHINEISKMTNTLWGGGVLAKDTNYEIDDYDWDQLISRYNNIRQNCICNTDCACNNVCSCHGDCGCNYSDIRLKQNIQFLGTRNGLRIYSWNYIWNETKTFIGVIAQELLNTKHSDALTKDKNGFYMVNYKKLPI